jgi:hypothetical protein
LARQALHAWAAGAQRAALAAAAKSLDLRQNPLAQAVMRLARVFQRRSAIGLQAGLASARSEALRPPPDPTTADFPDPLEPDAGPDETHRVCRVPDRIRQPHDKQP